MRYVMVTSILHAKQLEADPRVANVCMLVETFTRRQKIGAFLFWRVPVLRWFLRPILTRLFVNPYATLVFALNDGAARPSVKPEAPAEAPEVPNGDASD